LTIRETAEAAPAGERSVLGSLITSLWLIREIVAATFSAPGRCEGLASLLDKLHSASARGRRGNLSLVKSMTTNSPSA
jgi:hypothetical protein